MSNGLFLNGFIIQGLYENIYTQKYLTYNGVGRYVSWPLFYLNNQISKKITSKIDNKYLDRSNICVIGDLELTEEYIEICREFNIATRVLLVESNCNDITLNENYFSADLLGFDLVTGYHHHSLLLDDLSNSDNIVQFKKYRVLLNNNFLFKDYKTINEYYDCRINIIDSGNGYNIETDKGIIIKLSEVTTMDTIL